MAREDERYAKAVQRTLEECAPAAEGVLMPRWATEGERTLGSTPEETRDFEVRALTRRLRAIGLVDAAA
ncbi:MAG: hypothetical protein ACR2KD_07500 [Thermoleophilaceae bacterium]|jgi:hypothetical protein